MKPENSIVFITGANRGIGRAYVEEFLKAGAKKIYLGVRRPETVQDLVAEHPEKLVTLQVDVTNPRDIEKAAEAAQDVEILINNAGVAHFGGLLDQDRVDHARHEMEANYIGPLMLIRAFAPILKQNGGGAIATVSSIGGLVVFPGAPTYCASKYAAHALIIAARMELKGQGTRVLGVYPGPVDTDMAKDIPLDKVSPNHIAYETIEGLTGGYDDILPDPYARETYALYKEDPKKAEDQMIEAYEQMAQAA